MEIGTRISVQHICLAMKSVVLIELYCAIDVYSHIGSLECTTYQNSNLRKKEIVNIILAYCILLSFRQYNARSMYIFN